MAGQLVFVKRITREMVRAEPEARFVFGDNVARKGMGGQAGAMRGEPNAIGVATKWRPSMQADSFFSDDEPTAWLSVQQDVADIDEALAAGFTVYFPTDGIGTGLSELPTRAPKLHKYITDYVEALAQKYPACVEDRQEGGK